LSYCINDRPLGVVIIEASTLEHARIATIEKIDAGMTFTEGHMLDAEQSALLKPGEIGRFLFLPQAEEIRTRFKGNA